MLVPQVLLQLFLLIRPFLLHPEPKSLPLVALPLQRLDVLEVKFIGLGQPFYLLTKLVSDFVDSLFVHVHHVVLLQGHLVNDGAHLLVLICAQFVLVLSERVDEILLLNEGLLLGQACR